MRYRRAGYPDSGTPSEADVWMQIVLGNPLYDRRHYTQRTARRLAVCWTRLYRTFAI